MKITGYGIMLRCGNSWIQSATMFSSEEMAKRYALVKLNLLEPEPGNWYIFTANVYDSIEELD